MGTISSGLLSPTSPEGCSFLYMTSENSHKTVRRASSKPRVQKGEIAFVEMTKSCARDLTDRIKTAGEQFAEMLYRAHQGRAWAALGYGSWKEYCREELQLSRPRSYQLLDFVEIKRELEVSTKVDAPQTERQTRALKAVPAEKRAEVWEEAVEAAGGRQVSGTDVEDAADKVSQSPKISGELRDEVQSTIVAALDGAWEKLKVHPEMDWWLFRSGVRAWLKMTAPLPCCSFDMQPNPKNAKSNSQALQSEVFRDTVS